MARNSKQSGQAKRTMNGDSEVHVTIRTADPAEPADERTEFYRDDLSVIIEGWDKLPELEKRDLMERLRQHMESPAAPRFDVQRGEDGRARLDELEGKDPIANFLRRQGAFATQSSELVNSRLNDIINFFDNNNRRGCSNLDLNATLAFVHGGKPADPVQSTLLVEMAATHEAAMRALGLVGRADMLPQQQAYGNLAVKLLNVFTRQAETLAKLQRGGEQVIRHVHIDNRGGQAVVTDQVVTGGVNGRSSDQQYGQGPCGPEMLGYDAAGHGVPIPCDEGEEAMPAARRSFTGGAKG